MKINSSTITFSHMEFNFVSRRHILPNKMGNLNAWYAQSTLSCALYTLLFHSYLLPIYWVEAIHIVAHLLNILHSPPIMSPWIFFRFFRFLHITTPIIINMYTLAPRTTHTYLSWIPIPSLWFLIAWHIILKNNHFTSFCLLWEDISLRFTIPIKPLL